jgi:hypothetical protein
MRGPILTDERLVSAALPGRRGTPTREISGKYGSLRKRRIYGAPCAGPRARGGALTGAEPCLSGECRRKSAAGWAVQGVDEPMPFPCPIPHSGCWKKSKGATHCWLGRDLAARTGRTIMILELCKEAACPLVRDADGIKRRFRAYRYSGRAARSSDRSHSA